MPVLVPDENKTPIALQSLSLHTVTIRHGANTCRQAEKKFQVLSIKVRVNRESDLIVLLFLYFIFTMPRRIEWNRVSNLRESVDVVGPP